MPHAERRVLSGLGVSPGVAVGPVVRATARAPLPADQAIGDVETAHAEVLAALEVVAAALEQLAGQTQPDVAGILTAQAMILRDPVLADGVRERLRPGGTRAEAISGAFAELSGALRQGGEYFSERAADVDDLEYRVLLVLLGVAGPTVPPGDDGAAGAGTAHGGRGAVGAGHTSGWGVAGASAAAGAAGVLVATDLGPADVAGLRPGTVAAIVTEKGGATGHTAIIAKSLALPAVVGCRGVTALAPGTQVLVDGRAGTVIPAPSVAEVETALTAEQARLQRLEAHSGAGRTRDGQHVKLLVNTDAAYQAAAAAGSEGVGLLRTEFLYLDREQAPSLEEQEATYRAIFTAFAGQEVTVRTLDAGSDKPLAFIGADEEPNPALGLRGLRIARAQPELLDAQLRAIALAAAGAPCRVLVMAPMVATVGEARDFAYRARAHGLPAVGVMAEVPALVLRADRVLRHCDFLSLGTNDLAQYTFAADRTLAALADLTDPWEPVLLELVRLAAAAGRKHGRPVGVCGEAASDPLLALVLAGLGVTSLSMAPVSLPEVRSALAGQDLASCQRMAAAALDADDAGAAREAARAMHDAG